MWEWVGRPCGHCIRSSSTIRRSSTCHTVTHRQPDPPTSSSSPFIDTTAQGNGSPTVEPTCSRTVNCTRRPGGGDLDERAAVREHDFAQPVEQPLRVPADADVAVEQEDVLPASFERNGIEHALMDAQRAVRTGEIDEALADVEAEDRHVAPPKKGCGAAGATADIEHRTGQAFEETALASGRFLTVPLDVERHGESAVGHQHRVG